MTKYVIVLDTETTNSVEQPIPYDIGGLILNTQTGETVETFSFVVAEIFLDKEMMSSAYYAEKFHNIGKVSKKVNAN